MWFKKKPKCSHECHFVIDSPLLSPIGGVVDIEDGCYIFCPKCNTERHVIVEDWNRINKQQEIKKKYEEGNL